MRITDKAVQERLKQALIELDLTGFPDDLSKIHKVVWFDKYVSDDGLITAVLKQVIHEPIDNTSQPQTWESLCKLALSELYNHARGFRPNNGRSAYSQLANRAKQMMGRLI